MTRPTGGPGGSNHDAALRGLPAVRRAYSELRDCGQPDHVAFDAALAVYRWHHPTVPDAHAAEIVSRWVWTGPVH